MPWDTGLLPEQRKAACHIGSHACLRAGPGTGKTLTLSRRVVYLITEQNVSPNEILALTFTRAAVHELRQKIQKELEPYGKTLPRVSTLHSFALRQLVKNSKKITTVPKPLRIADDWEERNIILEDLKVMLRITLRKMRDKFNRLSADWQRLKADEQNWEEEYQDPEFIGAWREHSQIYGYTLRLQLVYELKKALEHNPDFVLEKSYTNLLVDEYQDLNPCDLAMIRQLVRQGSELFATGDDDQSIYGFRFAEPEGIRRFEKDYHPSSLLELEYCKRCDRKIIDMSQFVVRLDPRRIKKRLSPMPDADDGEVQLLWFNNQNQEAKAIARICKNLVETQNYNPKDILILLRTDRNGVFSETLRQSLEAKGIPVAPRTEHNVPLDYAEGRELLSYLRLIANHDDHLAWRTLLKVRRNFIGPDTISAVYDWALRKGITFTAALEEMRKAPDQLPRLGNRLYAELTAINNLVSQFSAKLREGGDLIETLRELANQVIPNKEKREEILACFQEIVETSEEQNLVELLSALSASMEDKEQDIDHEKVNILTMHKAKGLTADVVFLIGAEDEHIPGTQLGEDKLGDERRLLYVSLTRARHKLFITRCKKRIGNQMYTGRNSGKPDRELCRFLRDIPIIVQSGIDYLNSQGI
jgi:DNA helicase-2/ATP-dependent DNA helicase PcrA